MDNRQKRLVIRISRDHLSFSTADASEVIYENYPLNSSISMAANLREALRTLPLLENSFGRVLVMVDSPTLMVPTNHFAEEDSEMLYRYTFTNVEQHLVLHTVLPDLNAVVLFAVQKDLYSVIANHFSMAEPNADTRSEGVSYSPAVAPVWRHLHQRSYTGQRQKLYGYFHGRKMEVFSFQQNRFKFCNSYAVSNPNDALYYLLAVWKQLSMEAEHDELHLAGDIPEREQLMEEAQKFVKRVFYINPSGEFNRAPVTRIQGMPYDLMTLYVKGR